MTDTPAADFTGTDSFTYTAAEDDSATGQSGAAINIDVLTNDTDAESAELSIESVSDPANGAVTIDGDAVVYISDEGFAGTDIFTYTVVDNTGGTATVTVTVQVFAAPLLEDPCQGPVEDQYPDDGQSVHEETINCATSLALISGFDDGTFRPHLDVTRGQAAKILAGVIEAAGGTLPASPSDVFGDDELSVYEDVLNQLAEIGVLSGFEAGTVRSHEVITRAQAATMLDRTWALLFGEALPVAPDAFDDDERSVHESAINRLAAAGIIDGFDADTFGPHAPVTRGQLVSLSIRLLDTLATATSGE